MSENRQKDESPEMPRILLVARSLSSQAELCQVWASVNRVLVETRPLVAVCCPIRLSVLKLPQLHAFPPTLSNFVVSQLLRIHSMDQSLE
jgi:hypothetical protein